jgi:hypothetical protein
MFSATRVAASWGYSSVRYVVLEYVRESRKTVGMAPSKDGWSAGLAIVPPNRKLISY